MTKKEFNDSVKESCVIAVKRCNELLGSFQLSLSINWEYDFDGEFGDVIGVYEGGSVFSGEISIGMNMVNLRKCIMKYIKSYPWSDAYTMLDEAICTNIYHEMGHGLVELIGDYLQETDELDSLYDNNQELFDYIFDNEEDAVEKFAWCMYDNKLNESELYKVIKLYLSLYNEGIMEKRDRIGEIIMEEISALDFFSGLNKKSGEMTPWNPETKMERMNPSNAARASYNKPNDVKYHSYQDWLQNFKSRGISYQEYMKMEL